MKQIYKTLLLVFIPIFCLAQSNYKTAYVVTEKGDTLRGFINYREWDQNPVSISFKSSIADNTSKNFTTNDISFFSVNGLESYQRYTGPITMDETDVNHVAEGRDSSFKTATVFLRVLQKGDRLTLYSYSDNLKTRFYIQEPSDEMPKELIYRLYIGNSNINTSGRSVNENTYLKQLLVLAQKYNVVDDSFQWEMDHAGYNKTSILKLVTKINGISKAEYDKTYNEETNLHFFAGAAVNITTFSPYGPYQTAGGQNYTSILPAVSFGINIFANPNTGVLVFRLELMLAENQYKSNYVNKVSPYVPITYSYNQLAVGIAPQVIYNFYNAPNFKVYAGLGLAVTSYSYSNANFASTDGKTPVDQIIQNDPKSFSSFNALVMLKAGVQFSKNWGVFADYLTDGKTTHDPYFVANFSTIQLGINYFFK